MINRVILKKKWKHQYKDEPYPVGTILQPDNGLRAFLLDNNIAKEYKGEYPPKKKQNIKLEQLK